ncbi:uncharacterized protein MONOS_8209 [Monocercomonoides exilis]|uniref:uncharacterized protein n=1 Tax=Monocercomonoides exilis TaxID=2049356 RepID=UPI00355A18CC|nr:hypothetical protein MONOS_8209 [Monocercomonoides exilis]|eukprot:MONOS_8209.1-p1 / transcript=MONOS_8209.1 / gene=MONOS_8209 / organism=Monocercomonoides_exilis_PA203 / gene_product=unspecified product / transcript_product=unspecified product / location=Mono_scaffold00303:46295-46743(+) / protein_length=123 / sequence_SO=supercontig / SO=protein_coding / is_pseudo=false
MEEMDGIEEMRCEGDKKEDDEYEKDEEEEEREEGEKRKGWMREMNEEKEEWEMEKEAGIGEWACGRRLFGVEKMGKEKMAGWWVVREKFVRAMEAWPERKSGDFVAGLTWQVEEQMVAAECC